MTKLKQIIGYLGSWALFWLGHLISIPMCKYDWCAFLYSTYNKLMSTSQNIQQCSGANGPWKEYLGEDV